MSEVRCPVDGCGYVGEPSSVEAHISGSTDQGHRGKLGRDHRDYFAPVETGGESGQEATSAVVDSSVGWALIAAMVVFLLVVVLVERDTSGDGDASTEEDVAESEEDEEVDLVA